MNPAVIRNSRRTRFACILLVILVVDIDTDSLQDLCGSEALLHNLKIRALKPRSKSSKSKALKPASEFVAVPNQRFCRNNSRTLTCAD